MKPIHYIIAASLILNAALLIHTKPFTPAPSAPAKPPAQQHHAPAPPAPDLRTATPGQLTQQLAAMGFSPDIIRAVVRDRILKTFTDRRNSIINMDNPRYWDIPFDRIHNLDLMAGTNPAQRDEYIKAMNEANEAMGKLISAYPDMEVLRQSYADLPGLSDEQMMALRKASFDRTMRFNAISQKLQNSGTGTLEDKASQQKSLVLQSQQQYHEELSKILAPDQLSEYEMRTDIASIYLGNNTKLLDVTEREYRDMHSVYQEYYKNTPFVVLTPSQYQNFITTAGAQLQQLLGPDRYADFQQASNPAYEKLNQITTRLDLPLSAAREVVTVQTALTQRAAAIDSDPTLTPDQRAAQYTALAQEARQRITQTLGPDGYTAYRDNSANWLQTLESGKPPPPAK